MESDEDTTRRTTWSEAQTSARSVLARSAQRPAQLLPYLSSATRHRDVGPLTSRGRPGAVAMVHTGRCGSTVLTDLLDQHPEMYWDGETYGRVIQELKDRGQARSDVSFDPVEYVAKRLRRSGRRWFGFDLKFSHVTEFGMSIEQYVAGLRVHGVEHFVALRRRNYLRQVISGKNGGRRGQFHVSAHGERSALPPLKLDPESLVVDLYRGSLLEHFERWDRLYDELADVGGDALLWLEFEQDIEADPVVAYRRVAEALGLSPFEPAVRLRRSNPEPIGDLLADLDGMRDYLSGTSYAWMIESA